MSPTMLFTLQGIVVLLGPVLLAWWIRQRFGSRWANWGWGALAFIGSQLVRMPLLIGLTVLAAGASWQPSEETAFWMNLVLLSLSAGLFEESARYLVMQRLAPSVRRWREALMFGAGHGGIEAMLFVGGAVIGNLVFLSMGDTLLAQSEVASPEQTELLRSQLEALRTVQWWMPLAAIWERVAAITFHIAASMLVMRSVIERRWLGWGAAVLYHALFNVLTLLALRYGGVTGSTLAVTVLAIPALLIIVQGYRADQLVTPVEGPDVPSAPMV